MTRLSEDGALDRLNEFITRSATLRAEDASAPSQELPAEVNEAVAVLADHFEGRVVGRWVIRRMRMAVVWATEQDLEQTVWVELLARLRTGRIREPYASLTHFLNAIRQIARSRYLDWVRTEQRRSRTLLGLNETQPFNPADLRSVQEEALRELRETIELAIERLPEDQRVVFQARQEGLTYQAVSRRLGHSLTWVFRHYQEALQSITAFLEAHGY